MPTLDLPTSRRYETVSGLDYEILSSKKTHYYTVSLLSGVAVDCECRYVPDKKRGGMLHLKTRCKHMEQAEQAEAEYQRVHAATPAVTPALPERERPRSERGSLNHANVGFRLYR